MPNPIFLLLILEVLSKFIPNSVQKGFEVFNFFSKKGFKL